MDSTPSKSPCPAPVSHKTAGLPRIDPRWDEPEVRKLIQSACGVPSDCSLLATLVRSASRILGSQMCMVTLVDRDTVRMIAAHGAENISVQRSSTICGECVRTAKPIILDDLSREPRYRDLQMVSELGIGHYAGAPLIASDGNCIGVFCVMGPGPRSFTDDEAETITDFASTAAQLLDQQRRLAEYEAQHRFADHLLNSLVDGVYTLTPIRDDAGTIEDFLVTMVNATAPQLIGKSVAEVVGRRFTEVVPTVKSTGRIEQYKRVLETGIPFRNEVHYDAPPIAGWFEVSAIASGDQVVATFRNIDQRKQDEANLAQAHQRFELLSSATDDIVWDCDMEGNLNWWSETALLRLGYSHEEIQPRLEWWESLVHPDERKAVADSFARAFESDRTTWSAQYRLRKKNGDYIPVLDRGYIVRDENGNPTRSLGAIIDLSDEVRSSEEIFFHRALLEAQAEASQDAILVTDAEHARVRTNRRFRELAGDDSDTLDPIRSLRTIYADSIQQQAIEAAVRESKHNHGLRIGCEFEFGDGRAFELCSEPITHESGRFLGRVWFVRDLTRQRESNQLLRAHNLVLEASGVVLFRWSAEENWPVKLVSRNVEQFGYTAEELLSRQYEYSQLVHPEDLARITAEVDRQLASKCDSFEQRYRIVCKNGDVRWVYDKTTVERDDDGELLSMQGVILDTTDRYLAEAELAQSEAMLKELTSQIPGAVYQYRLKPDGTAEIPYISEGVRQICGVSPADIYRDPDAIPSMIVPEDIERFRESIDESGRTLEPWFCEFRVRLASGEVRWMSGSSKPRAEADGSIIWHGLLSDISERKAAHEALKRTSILLERTNALAHVGGWEYDSHTGDLYVSAEVKRILGVDPDTRLSLEEALAFYTNDSRQRLQDAMRTAFDTAKPYDLELEIVTRTGERRWVRAQGELFNSEHSTPKLRGALHDIHEQTLARQELARRATELETLRDAAEAASRSKSEFIANMSHEIRTPLTAILGFAELVHRENPATDEDRRCNEAVRTIHAAGRHLLTIINDILDLSRIEAGRMQIDLDQTDLPDLLQDCLQIMRAPAVAKGIQLHAATTSPIPRTVITDPTRLRQMLINLLGNAIKFTERGSVTLRAGIDDQGVLVLDIEDTGPGIEPDKHSLLFQAFSQADASTRRRHGGTGLGLAISRRCANLMGGEVALLRSVADEGSVFRITLPIAVAAGSPTVASLDEPSLPATRSAPNRADIQLRARILFAEDGPDNQRLVAFHLRKAGAEVDLADNGQIALDMFNRARDAGTPYDLVLTDIQMPEMDGYELTRAIRAEDVSIPVIAITAHAMPEDRDRCLAAGCNDYTTKPINRRALLETCSNWLSNPVRDSRKAA